MIHADDDGRTDQKRHRGKQLIADTEERPDRTDVSRVDEVAPCAGKDRRGDDDAGPPILISEARPNLTHHLLQEEAAHTGAGIHCSQNEHGFKHDGEVIPIGHQAFHSRDLRENVSHADGERHRAARTVHQVFLNLCFKRREFNNVQTELGKFICRSVNGEVVGRNEHAGGNERHDGHEAFHQHCAVTDEQNILFIVDHLRRRARADSGMEARKRAAGDGDEEERNNRTADDRAAAVDEFRNGRHVERGHHEGDADGQRADRADLQEGGEVVARQQQEPHRQNRSEETVSRDDEAHLRLIDVEPSEVLGVRGNPRARKDAEEEQYDAHDGRAAHVALTPNLHVKPHQNGDRNRAEDGVGRPERIVHRVDDSNRKTCQREQQNGQHSPRSNAARSGVNFLRSDVGQRLPAVANRAEKHDHVVHAASEHAANQDPEQTRQIAELRCQHRTEQRTGSRNGGKVMPEEHVFISGDVVFAVLKAVCRGFARRIDVEHLLRHPQTVETVCDGKDAQRRKYDGDCIHPV